MDHKKIVSDYLQETNGRQMTGPELKYLISNIKFPCRMLVFGIGADSKIWCELNKNGHTVFVEDNQEWIDEIRKQIKGFNKESYTIIKESYWTDQGKFRDYLGHPGLYFDKLITPFEVVFVDGPFGKPAGRCQSIATASKIQKKFWSKVFIHDCHRGLEVTYSDYYFKKEYKGIHHLRMYEP